MKNELKIGDKVRVMDQGLLMLMGFMPKGTKPCNEGWITKFMDDGNIEIEFPIGDDDPKEHSQVSFYHKSIVHKI